jgi:hypothetical protein
MAEKSQAKSISAAIETMAHSKKKPDLLLANVVKLE